MNIHLLRRLRGAVRVIKNPLPVYRAGRVYPPRKSLSLPSEITRKQRVLKGEKTRKSAFSVHSPEEIQLKAERKKFMQEIEEYRKKVLGKQGVIEQKKVVSEHYKKKKQRQKGRRKEKHELIKSNRKALVEIFGDAVFKRGWPISRK